MEHKIALVIDSGHDVSKWLSQILTSPEWVIQEAPDNTAALETVKSNKFDLILTSERSPAKQDLDLLRSIRRLHEHTRMIILTDNGTPSDVIEAMREHAFSYFSHPFSFEELGEMIRNATQGPSWDDGIEILSATPTWIRLLARCELKTADRLVQFVREMIDLPQEEKVPVAWALRELLMNAIEYGAKFSPDQYVELSYLRSKRAVTCRVKDPGEGFSFDEIRHAAVSNPEDDPLHHLNYRDAGHLRPGGFGLLLARQCVDELLYNDTGNEALLIKYVDSAARQSS